MENNVESPATTETKPDYQKFIDIIYGEEDLDAYNLWQEFITPLQQEIDRLKELSQNQQLVIEYQKAEWYKSEEIERLNKEIERFKEENDRITKIAFEDSIKASNRALHFSDENLKLKEELASKDAELNQIKEENENFKTVMIAAAEEIQQHWQAHCDGEGYGPSNLMHRLEKGIPAKYGYTAGAFEKLDAELKEMSEALRDLADIQNGPPLVRYEKEWNEIIQRCYAIISKQEGK